MRGVRARVNFAAWCALVALAIQFALSSGHMCGGSVASPFGDATWNVVLDQGPPVGGPDGIPIPTKPQRPAFDFCAICAATRMAGSALVPATPSLPIPVAPYPSPVLPGADAATPAAPPRLFQARAPPHA
jgi:hypothetical protein